MATEPPPILRTIVLVLLVALGAAALVSATHEWSADRIEANERQRLLARLRSVVETVPGADRLEPLELSPVQGQPDAPTPSAAFAMIDGGVARAMVLAVTAPDGYNAAIRLLIGIDPTGTITGVRVVDHRETPGLGDAIDIDKSSWIEQFTGTRLGMPTVWAVAKDDGPFDSITGATVTPRAVVAAVHRALLYYEAHSAELAAAVDRAAAARAPNESADE